MAKVSPAKDDLVARAEGFEFRAMQRRNGSLPAKEWFDGLDQASKALFLVAARIFATNLRLGRPGDRSERVPRSACGVWEPKVTRPGASPPHLRAFFIRDRQVLWLTHGFTKQTNDLPAREIERADRIAAEWNEIRKGAG